MSTNPSPDYPQPQYMTLSPDWSALLKIGRAYRLLFLFNLICILLTGVFFVALVGLALTYGEELTELYNEGQSMVEQVIKEEVPEVKPELTLEFLPTEVANPSDESMKPFSGFDEEILKEKILETLGTTFLGILGLFGLAFFLMLLVQVIVQIIVLIRFANCPDSIVPGGHGVGLAYAICMGLTLLLGFLGETTCGLLSLVAFILFLVFSFKIAAAVQSERGKLWLKIQIGMIVGLFFTLVLAGALAFFVVAGETPELIAWGAVALVLFVLLDCFMLWLSLLMIYYSLGRDVPRFIEAVMAHYSGQMDEQR